MSVVQNPRQHGNLNLPVVNITELCVYLDICCLKYVDNLRTDANHLHHCHPVRSRLKASPMNPYWYSPKIQHRSCAIRVLF